MYRVENSKQGLDGVFSAQLSYIDLFCRQVEDFLEEKGLIKEQFKIILGLREILTNAVRHGCDCNQEKQIRAGISFKDNEIRLYAHDPGQGYSWQEMLSCPPGIDLESGRGLCILQQYFSAVEINKQGNKIELHKIIE